MSFVKVVTWCTNIELLEAKKHLIVPWVHTRIHLSSRIESTAAIAHPVPNMSGYLVANIAKQPTVTISLRPVPLCHMATHETQLRLL